MFKMKKQNTMNNRNKKSSMRRLLRVLFFSFTLITLFNFESRGQDLDVALISSVYDKNPYPAYNPDGTVKGTYTIDIRKSPHTLEPEQFTINVTFPPGAVFNGNATLPAEFEIIESGETYVVFGLASNWSGSGPTSGRKIVISIDIVAPADEQPTGTTIQWIDLFTDENPQGNISGTNLNVESSLPVTLTTFKASEQEGEAYISWATTEVQRSLDGKSVSFTTVGKVSAKGVNGKGSSYGFTDRDAPKGQLLYYRLKMIDRDGTSEFSPIESLALSGVSASVYPNPARDFVTVNAAEPIRSLELINLAGQGMNKTRYTGDRKVETLQFVNTPSGVYQVKIEGVSGVTSYKKVVVGE
jgi:hypothetical protein